MVYARRHKHSQRQGIQLLLHLFKSDLGLTPPREHSLRAVPSRACLLVFSLHLRCTHNHMLPNYRSLQWNHYATRVQVTINVFSISHLPNLIFPSGLSKWTPNFHLTANLRSNCLNQHSQRITHVSRTHGGKRTMGGVPSPFLSMAKPSTCAAIFIFFYIMQGGNI